MVNQKSKKDEIWKELVAARERVAQLEDQLKQEKDKTSDQWGGFDMSLPDGMLSPWRPGLFGVLIGAPSDKQLAADNKRDPQHRTVANIRFKFRGNQDEIDLSGIQVKYDTVKREYWLALPGNGKGKKRFNYVQSKNGIFKSLLNWAIKKIEQGNLPKVFGKAERKPTQG